jgi:hypothetical protein
MLAYVYCAEDKFTNCMGFNVMSLMHKLTVPSAMSCNIRST